MKKSIIENQFKEKINTREITPSKASWDRLDAMLTVAEKPKRSFKWVYVAASFLGFLFLGTLYFNQNNKEVFITNDVVTVKEPKVIELVKETTGKENLSKSVEDGKIIKEQLVSTEIKKKVNSNPVLSNEENRILEKEVIKEERISIINQKTEQPVVLQKSRYVNVDELLASVDNASPKKSFMPIKPNVKVNSDQLLSQVDGELDLSFREKAIKTVNQNFKAVKLALSNRNSE